MNLYKKLKKLHQNLFYLELIVQKKIELLLNNLVIIKITKI